MVTGSPLPAVMIALPPVPAAGGGNSSSVGSNSGGGGSGGGGGEEWATRVDVAELCGLDGNAGGSGGGEPLHPAAHAASSAAACGMRNGLMAHGYRVLFSRRRADRARTGDMPGPGVVSAGLAASGAGVDFVLILDPAAGPGFHSVCFLPPSHTHTHAEQLRGMHV